MQPVVTSSTPRPTGRRGSVSPGYQQNASSLTSSIVTTLIGRSPTRVCGMDGLYARMACTPTAAPAQTSGSGAIFASDE